MKEDLYIYQHLGLGDHILCNAITRHYAKDHRVHLFVKPNSNFNNVKFMFRDNPNIYLIGLDDNGVKQFQYINKDKEFLIVGHTAEFFRKLNQNIFKFDEGFYETADLPLSDKWDKFYLERDLKKEAQTFELLGLDPDGDFNFVHDDPARGRVFRNNEIGPGRNIRPVDHPSIGLFDFLGVIEKAREVHVMNSSFACLIDTMQLRNDNLYYHDYARTDMGENGNPTFKLDWKFLK